MQVYWLIIDLNTLACFVSIMLDSNIGLFSFTELVLSLCVCVVVNDSNYVCFVVLRNFVDERHHHAKLVHL